ncbi:MAG: mannose-1-phosphate guanylyltransferase [Bacillota bacterium]|jgi:mannose-1-phosphate guanylyltransferase
MSEKIIPLIIAGGKGSRFWPLSRENRPKQFLDLDGRGALLSQCLGRAVSCAVGAVPYVIAGADQAEAVVSVLGEEGERYRFIPEPMGRNTAAAVAWGCRVIRHREGEGVAAVMPADHLIADGALFEKTFRRAAAVAQKERALTVIAVPPRYPATGYGYAERDKKEYLAGEPYYRVKRFVEKPHREKARRYLKKGTYDWNSGIVAAPLDVFEAVLRRRLPDGGAPLYSVSPETGEGLNEAYAALEPLSFDRAVLEKEKEVFLVEADFGWEDVGSFHRLASLLPTDENGNVRRGNHVLNGVRDSVVITDNRLTAVIGVRDLVVIEDRGVLLICPRRRVEEIGETVAALRDGNEKYR